MSFLETPRFTQAVQYGYAGGPRYSTDVVVTGGGQEFRNQNWANSRGRWVLTAPLRDRATLDDLQAFFHAVAGRAHGFRFKDWLDFQVTTANGRMGSSAYGTGKPTSQLQKAYTKGALTTYRDILKPVATPTIYRAGVAQTPTTHFTLDLTTGIVTWVATASRGIAAISKANPGVIRTSTNHPFSNGDEVYLTGIGGMTELNGRVVTVTVVDTDEFSIGISTTGYTTYTTSGTVAQYVQTDELLTWEGEFDVPARFESDEFDAEIRDREAFFASGLPIIEVRP